MIREAEKSQNILLQAREPENLIAGIISSSRRRREANGITLFMAEDLKTWCGHEYKF
jgi:hypothetical protein